MLAKRIKARRLQLGMTQVELALKAKVQQPFVAALEKGRENPTLRTLERMANALRTSVAKLLS
jgi:transcriptional regulator with XRE-family HTH domain